MTTFPLKAGRRSNAHDQPKPATVEETICLFDAFDNWVSIGGGVLELPLNQEPLMDLIAATANAAYDKGTFEAQRVMREAIGIYSPFVDTRTGRDAYEGTGDD